MDGWKKFEETRLPPKDAFYSRLNTKGISDHDYEHAQKVWKTMEKKTLGCYNNTYLKTDVLLLVDVFETFRNTCLKNYKLDPAHFYTAQELPWKALLKTAAEYCEHEERRKECEVCPGYCRHEKSRNDCKVRPDEFRLELVIDIDMLLMFQKGIRDGITHAVKRYTRANNKYMNDLYNPDEVSIFLQYVDINNEYGWAMNQDRPTHGFKWKNGEDFTPEKIDEFVKKDERFKKGRT